MAVLSIGLLIVVGGWYAVWLRAAGPAPRGRAPRRTPRVAVIVPVYEERDLIAGKLENLDTLRHPRSALTIILVDGGSSDGSLAAINGWVEQRPHCRAVATGLRDKTAQINIGLRFARDVEWVLVTDADARLAPDTLERLLVAAHDAPDVAVVGATVRPTQSHALERLHWQVADRVRLRESARGTASIVTAPCYLFRRELMDQLPPDTIADDIHVACRAMAAGRRVAIAAADVRELRSPRSVTALFRHKLRKGDAYLREIFRFLPLLRRFTPDARVVFGIRALVHLVVPPIAFGTTAWAAFHFAMLPAPVLAVAVLTLAAALVTSRMARAAAALCCLVLMLVAVTTVALAAYPFSTQTASWRKIAQASKYRLSEDVE